MDKQEIKKEIFEILLKIDPDIDPQDLKTDENLTEQMDLTSIDFLDVILEIRKIFGFRVPESDYEQLASIDQIVDYIEHKIGESQ